MSYWVSLENEDGECVHVAEHIEGGVYACGGATDASLNVTYNYGSFYYKYLDTVNGLRWLYGKQAGNCLDRLARAIVELGTQRSPDYWEATPGNAGHALSVLYRWAKQHPGATFRVT